MIKANLWSASSRKSISNHSPLRLIIECHNLAKIMDQAYQVKPIKIWIIFPKLIFSIYLTFFIVSNYWSKNPTSFILNKNQILTWFFQQFERHAQCLVNLDQGHFHQQDHSAYLNMMMIRHLFKWIKRNYDRP